MQDLYPRRWVRSTVRLVPLLPSPRRWVRLTGRGDQAGARARRGAWRRRRAFLRLYLP